MDIQTLAYLKSYVNKVVGVTDAFRYKGETYIRDVSLNRRTNWNDLAPCSIGDTYILTDTNDKEYTIINNKRYVVGDMIFTTNNVTVSEGQVSENVEVQVIGTRRFIDNFSILSDDRTGMKTSVGGGKYSYSSDITFNMNNLTTNSYGALDYYWEDIQLDKNTINTLIRNNHCAANKRVKFLFTDSQGNTVNVDFLRFTKYTNTVESETESDFWISESISNKNTYMEVVYFSDNYFAHLNVGYEVGLKPLTTYNLTVSVSREIFTSLDERLINLDGISITNINKDDRSIGKIHAKSAIETKKLSNIRYPLTETIYRLTAQETISGVTYKPGLYVYDISGASPAWIGVGGTSSGVSDVKIDGTSIVTGSVANIPTANQNNAGVVKVIGGTYGIEYDGGLKVINPTAAEINSRAIGRKAINPAMLDYAVKAAMCDGVGAAWSTTEQLAARNRMNAAAKEYEILASHTVVEGEEQTFTISLPTDTTNNHICIFMYNTECVTGTSSSGGYHFDMATDSGIVSCYLNTYSGTDRKMIYTNIDKIDSVNNIWLCSSHSQMNGYGTTLEANSYRLLNGTTIRSLTFVAADPNKYNVGTQIYVYKTK